MTRRSSVFALAALQMPDIDWRTGSSVLRAMNKLVLRAPAPAVALGYHDKHVAKVWTEADGDWKTYAPGDLSR